VINNRQSGSGPPLEKPGAGLEENGARGKRPTATPERVTGLTDKARRASVQAWEEFGERCEKKGRR
jgi:hypothetical protein